MRRRIAQRAFGKIVTGGIENGQSSKRDAADGRVGRGIVAAMAGLHLKRAVFLVALPTSIAAAGAAQEPVDVSRVVCVSKQINEFLYAIGAQDHLVGRDLTSIYPPEIQKLTSVGYHRALSAEGIISLRPSLFLTDGNVGPDAVLDQLRKVGVPILVLDPDGTVESSQALLTELGRRFHREQAADELVSRWNAEMKRILAEDHSATAQPKPRVLVIHFGQMINNYLAVGKGGATDQIIRWAGGVNANDEPGGMARLSPELIAKAAPDVIVATDVGFDRYGSPEKFKELPGVSLTPAAASGRIHRIDETELMYFGPRTPATIEKLSSWLRP
jgi:heme transport system substrate-binding protein